MNVTIIPTTALSGEVRAPPSKALTHRALFGGLLSNGSTIIHTPLSCDDTKATAAAVAALGAKLERGQESWRVWSTGRLTAPQGMIECGESGVTLRFTIPISSLVGKDIWLKGSKTLMGRPIEPLIESMKQLGADIRFRGTEVHVKAGRERGKCSVTGQYQFSIHLRFAFCRPANGRGAKDETHFALGITRLRINDN